ncbi:MAG: TIGR04282 family arsenosugar biosynthesis glycosyltransferase [Bacteroidetes bacterium]|nr:TIGR04282 family arsenosugar biosynthesis glycosyltransferase [Bacteroidota bacterium]
MIQSKTTIIIFGRYPHAGKVKTRLAATIGDVNAANLYRVWTEHTFQQLTPLLSDCSVCFYCSDSDDLQLVHEWITPFGFTVSAQSGTSLGERMKNAFYSEFQQEAERVIIIGTDAPDTSSEILELSISALDTADIVIGPALDGGYYLLGMNSLHEDLFVDIPWSTDSVLQSTIEKAVSNKLSVHLLPVLRDIDTLEDLEAWRKTTSEVLYNSFFIAE